MEINITGKLFTADSAANNIIDYLKGNEADFRLEEAQVYYDFPVLKDHDGTIIRSRILLISRIHGVITIEIADAGSRHPETLKAELEDANARLDQTYSLLQSRLVRNPKLRRARGVLSFSLVGILFAPYVDEDTSGLEFEIFNYDKLHKHMHEEQHEAMEATVYDDLISTVEGARGLTRPRARKVIDTGIRSKGLVANKVEAEITSFDERQKHGAITVLEGVQRIRGLAGSGKTVVLAMKAAQMHLREPEARILYTFYTRSLYQHIQRLITRFYRQFDDRDPDWNKVRILHAWGGKTAEGVYSNACAAHEVMPMSFAQAALIRGDDEFDTVCTDLLQQVSIKPMYDYIFVDEGQDFAPSFIKLCVSLAEKRSVVYAYDELQTIWRAMAPSPAQIFGTSPDGKPAVDFTEDIVLHKCYRNPREILVCAHALGFGIYGASIVQMLQNKEHWEDLGYVVKKGEFTPGSETEIERPPENSLRTISGEYRPREIVQADVYDNFDAEIGGVANLIMNDIKEGLRPDDILVEVVDDRNARNYLTALAKELAKYDIKANNIHADVYGIKDFYMEGHVTLSTVHKAKGNEAFMVYVIGVDALFASWAGPRERNMLFTAMTRAKGWVRVSGLGAHAETCKMEMEEALNAFPLLRFAYPSIADLRIMQRDLEEKAIRKLEVERLLERALGQMSEEEIIKFVRQRGVEKGGGIVKRQNKRKKR